MRAPVVFFPSAVGLSTLICLTGGWASNAIAETTAGLHSSTEAWPPAVVQPVALKPEVQFQARESNPQELPELESSREVVRVAYHPVTPRPAPIPAVEDIQTALKHISESLDATRIPTRETAEAQLRAAIEAVETYTGVGTERGNGWSRFLQLEALQEELEKARWDAVRLAELEMAMRQNYRGLEDGPMVQLRDAVNYAWRAAKYGGAPDRTVTGLKAQMAQASEAMLDVSDQSDPRLAESVGRIANLLHEAGQAQVLIGELTDPFTQPNFQMRAEEGFLNRMLSEPLAEPSPVDECILGTRVLGSACLRGSLSVDLLQADNGVSAQLSLLGNMTSVNRGYNRGVVLRTSGRSPVSASKRFTLNDDGIQSSGASVATNLQTSIHAIEHKSRLVRRIAKKKAAEQKSQADAISEGRLRRKLGSRFDTQVEERLEQANERLVKAKTRATSGPEVQRLGFPSPEFKLLSSDKLVQANVVQAGDDQLAASSACQLQASEDAGLIVELHQSMAINVLESLLANRTVTHEDIDDFAKQILGEVPEDLEDPADADPFLITMVGYNPVQVVFDDGAVTIILRFLRLEGRDRQINGAIVSATYVPSFEDRTLKLVRQGDLDIQLPTVRSPSQATTLRSAARAKLDPVFKQEIVTDPIDFSQRFPKAPTLEVASIEIDDGWLQVGLR